ncbi:MAG: response regulator [Geobacteraceae bacterium]
METIVHPQPKISFLCVEDDHVTRTLLSMMISMKFPGVQVHVAENGKIGLELYKEHAPEIIVTDVNMPVMDGITMATEIKAINPRAVIIVVSAYSNTDYFLNAIEIGINHYILKPIDFNQLFATINKSIAGIATS